MSLRTKGLCEDFRPQPGVFLTSIPRIEEGAKITCPEWFANDATPEGVEVVVGTIDMHSSRPVNRDIRLWLCQPRSLLVVQAAVPSDPGITSGRVVTGTWTGQDSLEPSDQTRGRPQEADGGLKIVARLRPVLDSLLFIKGVHDHNRLPHAQLSLSHPSCGSVGGEDPSSGSPEEFWKAPG